MAFVKIGDRMFSLEKVRTVKLGPEPTTLGVALNQVTITFDSGDEWKFDDEEADKLRDYFSKQGDVRDLMKPKKTLSGSYETLPGFAH